MFVFVGDPSVVKSAGTVQVEVAMVSDPSHDVQLTWYVISELGSLMIILVCGHRDRTNAECHDIVLIDGLRDRHRIADE